MAETSNFKFGTQLGFADIGPSEYHTNDEIGHGIVLYKIWRFPFFAMAEVAMAVPHKRYSIEELQILQ